MITQKTLAFLDNGHPLATKMSFDPEHPLQVEFSFSETGDYSEAITWLFSRDLLRQGLSEHTGSGDVTIRPASNDRVKLHLSSPFGRSTMSFSRGDLASFTARIYLAVPLEKEEELVSRDLEKWFRETLKMGEE